MNKDNYNCYTPDTMDYGMEPFVVNIDCFAKQNPYYRTALWTGNHLQVTLMSIPVCGDIGLEMHPNVDQFIRIEDGCALVMGCRKESGRRFQERTITSSVCKRRRERSSDLTIYKICIL